MRHDLLVLLLLTCGACATVEVPDVAPGWGPPDAEEPLSRQDCIRLATQDAPTAAAWRAKRLSAEAAARQAATLPNPAAALGWENLGLENGHIQTTASLAASLAALFEQPRQAAAARHDLDATRADLLAERSRLAGEVVHQYDELLAARRRTTLAEEAVSVSTRLRDAAARFAAVGERADLDVRRADAELAKAHADQLTAAADARAKEVAFAFALGFERPVLLRLSDELVVPSLVLDERQLEDAAVRRPELLAAQARLAAQLERAQLAADRLQFLPTVSGGLRHEGDQRSALASIEGELPIFDRGDASADAASAELLAAAAEVRRVARNVRAEIAIARERAATAQAILDAHARPLADARRTLRADSERVFSAGEASFDEAVLAQRDEIDARSALLDAELAVAIAAIDLDVATGRAALGDESQ